MKGENVKFIKITSFIQSGIRVEEQIAQEEEKPLSFQDLSLKEGQTIKVNINMPKKDRRSKVRMGRAVFPQGGPTEFYSGNLSISGAVREISV